MLQATLLSDFASMTWWCWMKTQKQSILCDSNGTDDFLLHKVADFVEHWAITNQFDLHKNTEVIFQQPGAVRFNQRNHSGRESLEAVVCDDRWKALHADLNCAFPANYNNKPMIKLYNLSVQLHVSAGCFRSFLVIWVTKTLSSHRWRHNPFLQCVNLLNIQIKAIIYIITNMTAVVGQPKSSSRQTCITHCQVQDAGMLGG